MITVDRTLENTVGNDDMFGLIDNEIFSGSAGEDLISGGLGIDTIQYSGNRSEYYIFKDQSSFNLVDSTFRRDGHDSFTGVERLQFADKSIALDFQATENAGKAAEFIGTLAFDYLRDANVFSNVLNHFDQGKSLQEVFQIAIDTGLVTSLAGSSSNSDLAKLAFKNVVGTDASQSQIDSLKALMVGDGGLMTQAEFLSTVAQLELNQQHVDLVGLQTTGLEYTTLVA